MRAINCDKNLMAEAFAFSKPGKEVSFKSQKVGDGVKLYTNREDALEKCFQVLDKDGSGFIELWELRQFLLGVSPHANLEGSKSMLEFLDADGDQKVSLEEYTEAMVRAMMLMSDEEFTNVIGLVMRGYGSDIFCSEPVYHHPPACRPYLEREVVPLLRTGLKALEVEMQKYRLELAAGVQCAPDGYRPFRWKPFQAMRWLADWLDQHNPRQARQESWKLQGFREKPWEYMSREEKINMVFKHLDRDGSGFLDASELLSAVGKLHLASDLAAAKEMLTRLDIDHDGRVQQAEYVEALMQMMVGIGDVEFDEAMRNLLRSGHISYCKTREEKFKFVFNELDSDGSGSLSCDELIRLALRMSPDASEDQIRGMIEFMDEDEDREVDEQEFINAMVKIVTELGDEDELNATICAMLEEEAPGAARHDPAEEVAPRKFQRMVLKLPYQREADQLGVKELLQHQAALEGGSGHEKIILVDVRPREEQEVSMIPGALSVTVEEEAETPGLWLVTEMNALQDAMDAYAASGGEVLEEEGEGPPPAPLIVAYCATGERAGPASMHLTELLYTRVYNLCGGIIHYYNSGGRVVGPDGAQPVEALHPGSARCAHFITRDNAFKAPKKHRPKPNKEGGTSENGSVAAAVDPMVADASKDVKEEAAKTAGKKKP